MSFQSLIEDICSATTSAPEELKPIHKRRKNTSVNNNDSDSDSPEEPTPYDIVVSKNESHLMKRLRKFERRLKFVTPLIWSSAIAITIFHLVSFVSMFYLKNVMWQTGAFGLVMGLIAGFGVTAGAHRYWCHRSYKASLPLQWILLICYSVAGQNNIFNWVRDHRVHHKFSETDADPHNAHRGFFFSHVGWLMMKKHPEVIRRGNQIDMRDILEDPLIKIHNRYFNWFKCIFCFLIPTVIPVYLWHETWTNAFISQPVLRYMFSLNFTWSVNSFAHMFGYKPYDVSIMPVENWTVSIFALGEGWHNYHHTFPWDYRAAELGHYFFNITTFILDGLSKIGWVYDTKTASDSLVRAVIQKRGGSS